MRFTVRHLLLTLPVCLVAGLAIAYEAHLHAGPSALLATVNHPHLPADGASEAIVDITSRDGRALAGMSLEIARGKDVVQVESISNQGRIVQAKLRASVNPGDAVLIAKAPQFKPARFEIRTRLDPADQFADGTPDFLRLESEADRQAFRHWFTFLAESTYVQKEEDRPKEITDCASLIRFAYREALRRHNGPWATALHLPNAPQFDNIRKYEYPHTPLGANLFRVEPGPFSPANLSDGTFREFADAETLKAFNTHFISRDIRAARPGDLLFFHQADQTEPFHSMIFLGRSHFGAGDDWVIYHTGPIHKHAGEIRRVTVDDLMQHPQVRWRPLPQNPGFLGVYRWNILREAD